MELYAAAIPAAANDVAVNLNHIEPSTNENTLQGWTDSTEGDGEGFSPGGSTITYAAAELGNVVQGGPN